MKLTRLEFLRDAPSVRILSHQDPDGDALGSALGLAHILKAAGKASLVHLEAPVPRMYRFLPAGEFLRVGNEWSGDGRPRPSNPGNSPEYVAILDCTSLGRLGSLDKTIDPSAIVMNIDHHGDNTRFGRVVHVDPTAAATAILVLEFAREAELRVPPEAATCLYTGLLTDTGRFTFGNTDSRALDAAAQLVRCGANPHFIAESVYEHRPAGAIRLLGQALDTLDLRHEGRVACLHVTLKMLRETGVPAEETEGFAAYARSIEGVCVGIFLRETEEGTIKVSFRSTRGIPVDGIANQFGGGGHPAAAGARVSGPLEEAKDRILRAVGEHLQSIVR